MKRKLTAFFVALGTIISGQLAKADGFDVLQKKFTETPKEQPLAVYWLDGNISEEGVVKDLQAMKQVGINRVQIGMIGDGQGAPRGPVRMFTDEWWQIMHTMFKTAAELDIEVGLFNCPGWSQSGGPWVKPEQSMRYLAAVNETVQGPAKFNGKLPSLGKDAQDVRVLAYPAKGLGAMTIVADKVKNQNVVELSGNEIITARSLVLHLVDEGEGDMELAVRKGDEWVTVDKYYLDRSNTNPNVGFIPLAPYVFSLPGVEGSEFRVTLGEKGFIGKIEISEKPQVEFFAEKTLGKMYPYPLPMWDDYLWRNQPEYNSTDMLQATQVIDITSHMTPDGKLTWDVPEGTWVISRTGMLTTGVECSPAPKEGRGLETDKMSKEHIRTHFDNYLGKIIERIPAQDRKTFKIVVEDSYETGGQNWTDNMIEAFKEAYGYDPVPYIPALSGTVVEVNEALGDSPELVNSDPYANWIIKVKLSDPAEVESLMDAAAYKAAIGE